MYGNEPLLLNTIKMNFVVTEDWPSAEHVFTAAEFLYFMQEQIPVNIDELRFAELLRTIPIEPVFNEHNHRYYYLLNSQ